MSDNEWHYLKICRGRFICSEHGAFCDSSDNYVYRCILCDKLEAGTAIDWTNNSVDRGLQIMRNLQNRSARNAAIVAGLFGILSVFLILNQDNTELVQEFASRPILAISIVLGIVLGLVSLGFFLSSMAHMPTIHREGWLGLGKASFMEKSLTAWEAHVAQSLSRFELRHRLGIYSYVLAIALASVGTLWTLSSVLFFS